MKFSTNGTEAYSPRYMLLYTSVNLIMNKAELVAQANPANKTVGLEPTQATIL